MPRSIVISLPPAHADALVQRLSSFDGLITLHRQRDISLQPPGDVVTVEVTDRSMPALMHVLDGFEVGRTSTVSVTMSEPTGMISASSASAIIHDSASSSFEEMEFVLERESNMDVNKLLVMAVAGAVAATGLASNSVHLVIAAMVIAPGFEPLVWISLASAGSRLWTRGLVNTAKGYGALLTGALGTSVLLPVLGTSLPFGAGGYLPPGVLVTYWSQITLLATLVAVVAGTAGALLIAANRAVLTAGVMIALGLVPGATLVAVGSAAGDLDLAVQGLLRWAHDAAIVVLTAAAVLAAKRSRRRRTPAL